MNKTRIRTLLAAVAVGAGVVLGFASPGQAQTIEEQCKVATIPTAICDGHGGVIPGGQLTGGNDSPGVGLSKAQGPKSYYSGNGPDVVLTYKQDTNKDGTPKVDEDGKPVMVPDLTVPGDPIFTKVPGDVDGKTANAGDTQTNDYEGRAYIPGK
jgi:hypothetical protein